MFFLLFRVSEASHQLLSMLSFVYTRRFRISCLVFDMVQHSDLDFILAQ